MPSATTIKTTILALAACAASRVLIPFVVVPVVSALLRVGLVRIRYGKIRWPVSVWPLEWWWIFLKNHRWSDSYSPMLGGWLGVFRNRRAGKWERGRLLPRRWGFRLLGLEIGDRG